MSTSPVSEAGAAPGGPFAALGRLAVRRRWLIVAAWAVLLAIALPLAPRVDRVVGIDLSAPMLARLAEKHGALRVFAARADAASLPFA
ncbi:MAG TPA: hypothetical protein VFO05_16385, partial [Candidatus Limnocylindrales bacterium]|nr:hypothetical protein [Candidatus Limnocylindrales bacterium]